MQWWALRCRLTSYSQGLMRTGRRASRTGKQAARLGGWEPS
nr:MAG TPA: hypothetical protein [Caudoviricetes sp.]